MIPGKSFTGERDDQGHYVLSAEGLAGVRDCINAYVAGERWPGVNVRRCSPHDLDSRFVLEEPCGPGERVFEVVTEQASPLAVITVLCCVVEEPGAEIVSASLDALLCPVADIEHQLGNVQAVASERCRGLGIERESRAMLRDAETQANRACDMLRAITSDPRNWRPISERAQMYAVAEIIETGEVAP